MLILQHVDDAISQQDTFFRAGVTNCFEAHMTIIDCLSKNQL